MDNPLSKTPALKRKGDLIIDNGQVFTLRAQQVAAPTISGNYNSRYAGNHRGLPLHDLWAKQADNYAELTNFFLYSA